MPDTSTACHRPVAIWLLVCLLCVGLMVWIGGLTRLTESGLSITEWQPVTGTLPPLNAAEWQTEFEKYRQSPQYHQVNKGMTLEEFKGIFFLEYVHRLLGRLVGVVFFLPFLWFMLRGKVRGQLAWKLAGIFLLGGAQGAVGWYMVKSGLVDEPRVSPYRLAFHLGTAFIIAALLLTTWLGYTGRRGSWVRDGFPSGKEQQRLWTASLCFTGFLFVQILWGAFVAGLDAGLTYNTFPLMDGRWIPKGMLLLEPAWRNSFENITMVQFNHRIGGMFAMLAALFFAVLLWRVGRLAGRFRGLALLVIGLTASQFALGVATLLLVVPVPLASLHQVTALCLFLLAIYANNVLIPVEEIDKRRPAHDTD